MFGIFIKHPLSACLSPHKQSPLARLPAVCLLGSVSSSFQSRHGQSRFVCRLVCSRVSGGYTSNGTGVICLALSVRLHLPMSARSLPPTRNKLRFDLSFLPCLFCFVTLELCTLVPLSVKHGAKIGKKDNKKHLPLLGYILGYVLPNILGINKKGNLFRSPHQIIYLYLYNLLVVAAFVFLTALSFL